MATFREKVLDGKEFVITCEFVPGRGSSGPAVEEVIRFGEKIISSGLPIHALSITDNPGGNPAIGPDTLAEELKKIGIEALVHFSCAGLNRNSIESRASGLSRKGLENLLIITGDFPVGGFGGRAKPVFDLDAVQSIRYLKDMNDGIEMPGKSKDGTINRLPKTNFFLASGVTPFGKRSAEIYPQFIKLHKKINAGVDLIIPNLGYDIRKFAEILKYLRLHNLKVPLFGNCYALSRPVARIMNKGEIAGCVVTDELLKIIEQEATGADKGKQARLDRASKLTAIFRGMGLKGVHLGGFGLKFEDFEYIIKHSEEIAPQWRDFIPEFKFAKKEDGYLFPEDPELSFAEKTMVPVAPPRSKGSSLHFTVSKIFHKLVFTKNTVGFALGKVIYGILEKNRFLYKTAGVFEHITKQMIYDCQNCGDCALFSTGYLCPMSACAKFQRNGPCGGSRDGRCEADIEKECVWARAYNRLAPGGTLESIKDYIPPVNNALARTSSWGNYYLGKDHAEIKTNVPKVN